MWRSVKVIRFACTLPMFVEVNIQSNIEGRPQCRSPNIILNDTIDLLLSISSIAIHKFGGGGRVAWW